MLSTVFIHMLSEVRESLDRAADLGMISAEMDYPLPELLLCAGNIQKSEVYYKDEVSSPFP